MNKKQTRILWITAIVLLLMLLFPPFQTARGGFNAGYAFIVSPPIEYANVNVGTLFIQCLIVVAVGAICWFVCKDKQKLPKEEQEKKEKDNS